MSAQLEGMRRAAGVAVAGAALILIALLFDTAPLFVPGVAFTALGIAMPAWLLLAAGGARAQRRLDVDRVPESQRFETTIVVRRGPLGLPGGEVFDPVTRTSVPVQSALSLVSGNDRASVTIVASFPRRGRKQLAPPSVICRDVLGLAEVVRPGEGESDELLVLPRTEPVKWVPARRALGAYAHTSPGRSSSEALAAAELDARCAARSLEALDVAVRAAGSIVLELARRGGCGLLMPGDRRPIEIDPDLTRWPVAHLRLALVEGGPDQRAPQLRAAARLGRVFYVAAEAPQRLPEHGQLPPVLVLPATVEPRTRGAVVFEVAGCLGYLTGSGRRASADAASREPVA